MKVIIAQDSLPKSIMLLGPTPRDKNVPSWRPGAIKILNDIETKMQIADFDIVIYTPTDLEKRVLIYQNIRGRCSMRSSTVLSKAIGNSELIL